MRPSSGLLPTIHRKYFLFFFGGASLLCGLLLGRGALFISGSILLLIPVAFQLLAVSQIRNIHVRRQSPNTGFEDQTIPVRLLIENQNKWPLFDLEVTDIFGPDEVRKKVTRLNRILTGKKGLEIIYQGLCYRSRGEYEIGPIEIKLSDPFECYELSRRMRDQKTFYVYPDIFSIHSLPITGQNRNHCVMHSTAMAPGWSQEFRSARPYQNGDPPRWIHWPQTARTGQLITREFETESGATTWIFLDMMREGRAGLGQHSVEEYAVKIAGATASHALQNGNSVGLVSAGDTLSVIPTGSGETHLHEILRTLISVRQKGTQTIGQVIHEHQHLITQDSTAIVIISATHFTRQHAETMMQELKGKGCAVIAVLIDDKDLHAIEINPYDRLHRLSIQALSTLLASMGAEVYCVDRKTGLKDSFVLTALQREGQTT